MKSKEKLGGLFGLSAIIQLAFYVWNLFYQEISVSWIVGIVNTAILLIFGFYTLAEIKKTKNNTSLYADRVYVLGYINTLLCVFVVCVSILRNGGEGTFQIVSIFIGLAILTSVIGLLFREYALGFEEEEMPEYIAKLNRSFENISAAFTKEFNNTVEEMEGKVHESIRSIKESIDFSQPLSKTKSEIESLNIALGNYNKSIDSLQSNTDDFNAMLEKQNEFWHELNKNLNDSSLLKDMARLTDRIHSLNESLQSIDTKEINSMTAEIKEFNASFTYLTQSIKEERNLVADLSKLIDEFISVMENKLKEMASAI